MSMELDMVEIEKSIHSKDAISYNRSVCVYCLLVRSKQFRILSWILSHLHVELSLSAVGVRKRDKMGLLIAKKLRGSR